MNCKGPCKRHAVISFLICNVHAVLILHELGGVFKPPILFLQPITQVSDPLFVMELDQLFASASSDVLFYYALVAAVAATILALTWTPTSSKLNLPPGPRRWPVIGNLGDLGSQPHITLMNLAQQYGPLMYLQLGQRDCIVASSPETAKEFLKTQDLNFSSRPHMISNVILLYNGQGTQLQLPQLCRSFIWIQLTV